VWELDLAAMSSLTSLNDRHRYLLNKIDAFSKYAYSMPIRSKTGDSITSAFRSILAKTSRSKRPLVVRADKGKEFVKPKFRMLPDD
jgi:hypothetical protein